MLLRDIVVKSLVKLCLVSVFPELSKIVNLPKMF